MGHAISCMTKAISTSYNIPVVTVSGVKFPTSSYPDKKIIIILIKLLCDSDLSCDYFIGMGRTIWSHKTHNLQRLLSANEYEGEI